MNKFARIENGIAVEVFTPPVGFTVADCFHADVAALFIPVHDSVIAGAVIIDGGDPQHADDWAIPSAPSSVAAPATVAPPTVTPPQFYMLFTVAEQLVLEEVRTTDPALGLFFKRLDDPRLTEVDLSLQSVQDSIRYALSQVPGVDVEVRYAEIITGKWK